METFGGLKVFELGVKVLLRLLRQICRVSTRLRWKFKVPKSQTSFSPRGRYCRTYFSFFFYANWKSRNFRNFCCTSFAEEVQQ